MNIRSNFQTLGGSEEPFSAIHTMEQILLKHRMNENLKQQKISFPVKQLILK